MVRVSLANDDDQVHDEIPPPRDCFLPGAPEWVLHLARGEMPKNFCQVILLHLRVKPDLVGGMADAFAWVHSTPLKCMAHGTRCLGAFGLHLSGSSARRPGWTLCNSVKGIEGSLA